MTIPLFPDDREKEERVAENERLAAIYGTREYREAYKRYINSAAWKKLCKQVRRRSRGLCERCGWPSSRLEVQKAYRLHR